MHPHQVNDQYIDKLISLYSGWRIDAIVHDGLNPDKIMPLVYRQLQLGQAQPPSDAGIYNSSYLYRNHIAIAERAVALSASSLAATGNVLDPQAGAGAEHLHNQPQILSTAGTSNNHPQASSTASTLHKHHQAPDAAGTLW